MKIYIATTFRDFNGSDNDKIQFLFLNSLLKQTYTNFELIVTTFGEKSVKKMIKKSGLNNHVIDEGKQKYRFSLSKVILNAVDYAERKNEKNFMLIWTTCDLIFESQFLEKINLLNFKNNFSASIISHPHLIFNNIKDVELNKYHINGPNDGIDFIGFSSKLMTTKFKKDLSQYFYADWGVFEHFLVAMAVKYSFRRFNIFEISQVKKIVNDRLANNESENYFKLSLNKNWPVFEDFLKKSNFSREYSSLAYCNLKFKLVGDFQDRFLYKYKFKRQYLKSFIFRKVSQLIPLVIKTNIKKKFVTL
jgi:hypothetical protein